MSLFANSSTLVTLAALIAPRAPPTRFYYLSPYSTPGSPAGQTNLHVLTGGELRAAPFSPSRSRWGLKRGPDAGNLVDWRYESQIQPRVRRGKDLGSPWGTSLVFSSSSRRIVYCLGLSRSGVYCEDVTASGYRSGRSRTGMGFRVLLRLPSYTQSILACCGLDSVRSTVWGCRMPEGR